MMEDNRRPARKLLLLFSKRTVLKYKLLIQWQGVAFYRTALFFFFYRFFFFDQLQLLNINFEPYEKSVSRRGRICIRTQWCESSGVSRWARVISALIGPATYRSIVVTQFQLCKIYRNFLFTGSHYHSNCERKRKKD